MGLRNFLLHLASLLISFQVSGAFNEKKFWFFGQNAGIEFGASGPVALDVSRMNTFEGSASISDENGNLLFYTDGIKVWNRNHQMMFNGSGLKGHSSSTQSALILPFPGINYMFYIFTTDFQGGFNGLNYSIVDISKRGGLGEVTAKNIALHDQVSEKLYAVKRPDGQSYWIISHVWNSDEYLLYLLSPGGMEGPFFRKGGMVHSGGELNANTIGYTKVSPNGRFLVSAVFENNCFELSDFNPETGEISNARVLNIPSGVGAYGVEFSEDSKLLYVSYLGNNSNKSLLVQIDLTLEYLDLAPKSLRFVILSERTFPNYFTSLAKGPDGKIYVSIKNHNYLSAIVFPEISGRGCLFRENEIFLNGKKCLLGLPNFPAEYLQLTSPVPLSYGYMKLLENGGNIRLAGKVILAQDQESYVIEHSEDGIIFRTIFESAKDHFDVNLAASEGKNHLRLIAKDLEGQTHILDQKIIMYQNQSKVLPSLLSKGESVTINTTKPFQAAVYDLTGRLIYQDQMVDNTLDLSRFSSADGLYFVHLFSQDLDFKEKVFISVN